MCSSIVVQAQTQANGFRVLYVHDVQATLAEKALVTMFQNNDLEDFAHEIEDILLKIIDQSV